jgi:transcriptional regulator with XRE-family HTH domain
VGTRTIEVADLVDEIERRMEELSLSANATADRIGITAQRLSQWRRGTQVQLDPELQQRLAGFLGCSPRRVLELLGYSTSDGIANLSAGNGPFPGLLCGRTLTLSAVA